MLAPNPVTAMIRFRQGLFIGEKRVIKSIVSTAPEDTAARIKPRPSEPTFKISCANTGNKATAPPKNTEKRSKLIAPSIIFVLKTNLMPSLKLLNMLSFGTKAGGWGLRKKMQTNAINMNNMMMTYVTVIPKKAYTKPPVAGPAMDAICQLELFHVLEFGYNFLGTIWAIREKVAGLKKPLAMPIPKIIQYIMGTI